MSETAPSTRYPVPVNVNTHIAVVKKPELILNRTLPDQVVPGNEFTLFLDLSNTGSSRADDITVAINASASSLSLNGPGNYYLGHLDPGDHATFNLSLSTDKDSPLGTPGHPGDDHLCQSGRNPSHPSRACGRPHERKSRGQYQIPHNRSGPGQPMARLP